MNVYEKRVENQVQFWTLIGPFLILLSIAVLLYKLSSHWYFPLSTLIGIPLCVKWKMKGMAAALACLLTFSVIGYQSLEFDQGFWHVGMSLALAFSFIILTLSLEEVEGLIGKLQLESQSRLDNCLRLDEKLKAAELEWEVEKERLANQVIAIGHDLAQTQEERQTFYKLVHLSKDELIQLRSQHDELLQNLFYKKQQLIQLNEKLEETELTVQSFVNTDSEQAIIKLKENISYLEQDKEQLNGQLEKALEKLKKLHSDQEALSQDYLALKTEEKQQAEKQQQFKKEHYEQAAALQQAVQKLDCIEKERACLQTNQTHLLQQCEEQKTLQNELKNTIEQLEEKIIELETSIETKASLIEGVSKNNQELFQQVSAWQSQSIQAEQKLQAVSQTKAALEKELQQQVNICIQNELELNNCRKDKDNAFQRLREIKAENEASLAGLELIKQKKESLEIEAQEMRAELLKWQGELKETAKGQERVHALEQVKMKLEQELEHFKILAAARPQKEIFPESRKPEFMYLQLKEQFQQKSEVLDATRRELFASEEGRLALLKEKEEAELYGLSEREQLLQMELVAQGKECEKMLMAYEEEIEEMSALIQKILS